MFLTKKTSSISCRIGVSKTTQGAATFDVFNTIGWHIGVSKQQKACPSLLFFFN